MHTVLLYVARYEEEMSGTTKGGTGGRRVMDKQFLEGRQGGGGVGWVAARENK